jgi:mono/diheme cytochrome c family protein
VPVESIAVPTDAESIARGEHWAQTLCIGCHGEDLSGGPFFEAPFGYIDAENLTSGNGGIGATFTDEDYVRALRHGLDPSGRSVFVMRSVDYWYFNDEDLGDLIAYLKSLPPVDKETREPSFDLLGKALIGAGVFDNEIMAELIPQDTRPESSPTAGKTPEYGEYLVNVGSCRACHSATLSGGKGGDPSAILAPNLTPGGEMVAWSEADFINALRTGNTPSGKQLDPEQMPWNHYKNLSDEELGAIFLYLQSLPKLETTVP